MDTQTSAQFMGPASQGQANCQGPNLQITLTKHIATTTVTAKSPYLLLHWLKDFVGLLSVY